MKTHFDKKRECEKRALEEFHRYVGKEVLVSETSDSTYNPPKKVVISDEAFDMTWCYEDEENAWLDSNWYIEGGLNPQSYILGASINLNGDISPPDCELI